MKFGKILAVLLALALALGCAAPAFAADAFTDVAEDAYYAAAVEWAVEKSVTNGMSDNEFRPDYTVNRAQAVTFLWRMAGEPEPTQTQTFADVEADGNNWWYKTAVQWAVEKGITNGTNKGFEPYTTCTRGMILTMLYRLENKPWDAYATAELPAEDAEWTMEDLSASFVQFYIEMYRSENGLSDIPAGAWYELPVYWALANGLLNGNHYNTEDMAIHPAEDCPRGEMVYFLYMDSGDAPAPAAEPSVQTGTIPETVLFDDGAAKLTLTGVESDEYGDPRLTMTLVNGTEKSLRAEVNESYLNTYSTYLQAYIPETNEEGWTFYADAVVSPGETKNFYVSLSSAEDLGFDAIYELELQMLLIEVEWNEEDDCYDWLDEYAAGELTALQSSLYDPSVSYDREGGTLLLDEDGLQVYLLEAASDDFWGAEMQIYVYNGSSEKVLLGVAEMKLDGESCESLSSVELPAGKREVASVYPFIMGDVSPAKEVEITFALEDPETWEPIRSFDPVTITLDA